MNENIKKLIREFNGIKQLTVGSDLEPVLIGKDIEEFAKLIVEECTEVCQSDWFTPDGWGYVSGQVVAANMIKKHFGVAE